MKRTALFLTLTLVFATWFNTAKGTHVMGADLYYTCLGNDSFLVHVSVFKDCKGSQLAPFSLNVDGISCSYSNSTTMSQVSCKDITSPRCPLSCTRCDQSNCNQDGKPNGTNPNCSFNYGFEKVEWEATIYLGNTKCCKFKLSYSTCCRNAAIGTGMAGEAFYSWAELDRCITPCNNPPILSNDPIGLLCVNEDFCFNNGAIDTVDYDSLSFELASAYSADGVTNTYSGSYSYLNPIQYNGFPNRNLSLPKGFHLDSLTGDLCFRPTQQQTAVIVVEIKEWRKDSTGKPKVIGVTRRDMQFAVLSNCNNNLPKLAGPFAYTVCAGDQLCFDCKSSDKDKNDTTRVSWNYGIPKGTFTDDNGAAKNAKGTFCWTPTKDDVSSVPYVFTVTTWDDKCPTPGTTTKSYSITVKPKPEADRSYTNLVCGKLQCDATPLTDYDTSGVKWVIPYPGGNSYSGLSATHQFNQGGTYVVQFNMQLGTCLQTYYDSVTIPPFLTARLGNDTTICSGKPVSLTPTIDQGAAPYNYLWSTGDSSSAITLYPTTDTLIVIQVTDNSGCIAYDTLQIHAGALPMVDLGPDQVVCFGDSVLLDAGNNNGNVAAYLWSDGPTSQVRWVSTTGSYWVKLVDTIGCIASDSLNFTVKPQVQPLAGPDKQLCTKNVDTVKASGADVFRWLDLSGTQIKSGGWLPIDQYTTGTFILEGTDTSYGISCMGYDTLLVTVVPDPKLTFPSLRRCEDWPQIALYVQSATDPNTGQAVSGTASFECPGNPSAVSGSIFYPPTAGATTASNPNWVVCTFTTSTGCVVKDSFQVQIDPLPATDISIVNFCLTDPPMKLTGTGYPAGAGTVNETWSGTGVSLVGSDYYFDPQSTGTGAFLVTYCYKTIQGCQKCDTAMYFVRPVPVNTFTPIPDRCILDGPLNLLAASNMSPDYGSWSQISGPAGSLSANGDFSPGSDGTYQFAYVVAAGGCKDSDVVDLIINPQPKVTIPNDTMLCIDAGMFPLTVTNVGNTTGSWYQNGNLLGSNQFDPSQGEGIYNMAYRYYDILTSCTNADSFLIKVKDLPVVSIQTPANVCQGNPVDLQGSFKNASGVLWKSSTGGLFTNATDTITQYFPSASDIATGSATLTLETTGNGPCPLAIASVTFTIYPTPVPTFVIDDSTGCSPHVPQFTASSSIPGTKHYWNFGDPESGTFNQDSGDVVSHSFLNNTLLDKTFDITLTAVSPDGCDTTVYGPVMVSVYPNPKADFTATPPYTTVALPKFWFTNLSTEVEGGLQYLWSFGDAAGGTSTEKNPVYLYKNDTGIYIVSLQTTSIHGCWDTISKPVVIGPDISVFIPNAFTPDPYGPSINNRFYVTANNFKDFEIYIFNRWGEILYRSTDITEGWNGYYKDEPCQIDVYVYEVILSDYAGKKYRFNGNVHLLR